MHPSQRRLRKRNQTSKKSNALHLELLESRMLLSGTTLSDLLAANSLVQSDPSTIWSSDTWISPAAESPSAGASAEGPTANAVQPSPSINPLDTIVYDTRADGMPILNSLPGAPGNIFLDFDGDATNGWLPFDMDGNGSTFNTTEQAAIVDTWRQTVDYYSMFDINVTTIQPNVATQPTAWHVISPSYNNGGLAWGIYPNTSPGSISDGNWSPFNVGEAIAHEVGHTFGCGHISQFDSLGNNIQVYGIFPDPMRGSTMGGSAEVIDKWYNWHAEPWVNPGGPSFLQDDMNNIATLIKNNAPAGYTGDGYRTDDFGGTIATAQPLDTTGTTQVHSGIIERLNDADAFSFTSAGGRYTITAAHEYPSPVDLKLSVYDSSGTLIASEDSDPRDQPYSMANDQYFSVDLPAGTYYAIVQSHGNYDDQGKYVVRVDPLPAGSAWTLEDVGLSSLPGYATFDSGSSTYTLAGCGYFIYALPAPPLPASAVRPTAPV